MCTTLSRWWSLIDWLEILIYIYTLLVCLGVCLHPMNVKKAKPIGPKFCVGLHMSPGKVYRWSKFQKFASNKIRFFIKCWNSTIFFNKIRNFFVFVLKICCMLMHCALKAVRGFHVGFQVSDLSLFLIEDKPPSIDKKQ